MSMRDEDSVGPFPDEIGSSSPEAALNAESQETNKQLATAVLEVLGSARSLSLDTPVRNALDVPMSMLADVANDGTCIKDKRDAILQGLQRVERAFHEWVASEPTLTKEQAANVGFALGQSLEAAKQGINKIQVDSTH